MCHRDQFASRENRLAKIPTSQARRGREEPLSPEQERDSARTRPSSDVSAEPETRGAMLVPFVQSDPERTRERFRRLREYVRQNLLVDGRFICKHYHECLASSPNRDAFYEGQMSHVGQHYDLTVGGQELRIVVVGQEYGSRHRCHTLEERRAMGDRSRGFQGRNPHMKGTTSLLRLMLGRGTGRDREGELLRFPHPQPVGNVAASPVISSTVYLRVPILIESSSPNVNSRRGSLCL